jgi:arylsulfatase A-like enzyme
MSSRPNILLITTDQHRFDFVTGGRVPGLRLPSHDRLRDQGTTLSHATSVCPVCMPARFAWLTGLYPSQVAGRLMDNAHDWPLDLPTMPQALQAAGYRTALIGKLHARAGLYRHDLRHDREQNRDLGYHDLVEVAGKTLANWFDCDWTASLADAGLLDDYRQHLAKRPDLFGRQPPYEPNPLPVEHNIDTFVADHAVRWLEAQQTGGPWFLHASFCGPHFPVDPPADYAHMFDARDMPAPEGDCPDEQVPARRAHRAAYCGLLRFVDDQIGRILDALDRCGLADSTLVICCTDHGDMLGHHGRINKQRPEDTSVRTPITARWPGRFPPGVTLDTPAESIDLPATILDAAGVDPAAALPDAHGRSLLALWLDGASAPVRDDAYAEFGSGPAGWRMLRTATTKYIHWADGGESLFDLQADPWETRNLAGSREHEPELRSWRTRLLRRLAGRAAINRQPPPRVDVTGN